MLEVVHWSWSQAARADANAGRWSDEQFHMDAQVRFGQVPKIVSVLRDLAGAQALGLSLVHVATVDVADPSAAFMLTNSIDRPWTHNGRSNGRRSGVEGAGEGGGVKCLVANARSTSCGDLIRRPPETGAGPGHWMVVAAVGFQDLPADLHAVLDKHFSFESSSQADIQTGEVVREGCRNH